MLNHQRVLGGSFHFVGFFTLLISGLIHINPTEINEDIDYLRLDDPPSRAPNRWLILSLASQLGIHQDF